MPVEVKVDGAGDVPEYSSDGAAGADLRAREAVVLAPGGRAAVATGLHVIEPGDRIGQLLVQRVERASFAKADSLAATSRGEGGFGSTGR